MKKIAFYLFAFLLLFSCNGNQPTVDKVITAKGGVRYGGTFRFMSNEKVTNLFPLETSDVYSGRISAQIYEGLLRIDNNSTEVVPAIAKEVKVNENSTVFTFQLRDDVYFHDDKCFENGKGRQVTAHDFKYALEFACSNNTLNQMDYLVKDKIKGAKEYFNQEANEVEGIKVKDDFTLEIELIRPFSGFKRILTHNGLIVFPKEAVEFYGEEIRIHPVGTGAFKLETIDDDKIILTKNTKYYRQDEFGNHLPFLDKVIMTYSKNKTDELLSFRAEEIDLVLDIPVEEIKNVLGSLSEARDGKNVKHIVDSKSSMSISYYGFATQSEPFSNVKVRQAFNLAINRKEIVDNWMEGEGWPVTNGFVPKMDGYPSDDIEGFKYNVTKAQELLKEAGYPKGNGFPKITLYVNALEGSGEHLMAQAVQHSLKQNLNVNIDIQLVGIEEREELVNNGTAVFWRAGWIADYPDPENFLSLFYGRNVGGKNIYLNQFKYESENFDQIFEEALQETDEEKRMQLLAKCDQMIINDAVVMPLITDDFITMVNLKVKKFVTNEMEQLDFSHIYIKEINN